MFVEEAGNPAGPALLLVHGFLSSAAQWDLNRDALGEHHRLIMVELVGHGRSEAPDDPAAYEIQALVGEFEQIRAEREIDNWWVCGQSLGGAISMLYTLAHPERVRGFVFTNSRAAFGIKRQGVSRDGSEPAPVMTSTRDLPVHPINAKRLPAPIKQRMVEAADSMPVHAMEHFLRRRHTWKCTDRMGELTMPVLLVNGRWEKAFQPYARRAGELMPQLERVDLEGGHAINAERPDGFNHAVIDFIQRHEACVSNAAAMSPASTSPASTSPAPLRRLEHHAEQARRFPDSPDTGANCASGNFGSEFL